MEATKEVNKHNSTPVFKDKRRSIDIGKALKLRFENGLTYKEIAATLNCSKRGIIKALKPFISLLTHPESLEHYKANRSKFLNAAEQRFVAEMVHPDKLKSASVNNLAYAANTVHNMYRLNEDKSTQNTESIIHVYHELNDSIKEMRTQLEESEGN